MSLFIYVTLLVNTILLVVLVYLQNLSINIYIEALGKVEERLTKLIKDKNL